MSTKDNAYALLTDVRFVVRECLHAELPHVSRTIDEFLNELPAEWSLDEAYKRTGSFRCMQYLASHELKPSPQSHYQAWIINNVAELSLKRGDVGALKWLVEQYAPGVSITHVAVVAAGTGRLDVLEWLYKNHCTRVCWGGSEWCEAVRGGHQNVVEWLRCHVKLHKEAAPQLMLDAAKSGDLLIVQWIHAEYELPVENALVEAQVGYQWRVVKWILANCEVEDPHIDMNAVVKDGDLCFLQWLYTHDFGQLTNHALEVAAFNGHLSMLTWLLDGPAKLDLSPSVLDEAARGGHLETVMWLHERRCPATTAAMDYAAENGFLEILQWLYANRKEGCTSHALDRAARNGHLDIVKWLQDTNEGFYCPAAINRAAEFGHLEVVKWLYANRTEGCSSEALDCACHQGHLDIAKWLHANGLPSGKWTMDLAAGSGHLDVVKLLHKDLQKTCTTWAMDSAARQGYLDVVKWLHSNRSEGCTADAMSAAAANGHLHVVRWLHENRSEGCAPTALNRAIAGGHLDVAIFLRRERGLTCSFRSDVTLRGLRLEIVQGLFSQCCDHLEQGISFQVARHDWHFNNWMRSHGMQSIQQDDRNVVWKWSPPSHMIHA